MYKRYGDFKIQDSFLYFHIDNQRNQLDSDSVCSCSMSSDTVIYSIKNEAVLGRISKSNLSLDWMKVYGAGTSPIVSEEIAIDQSNLYLTGNVFSTVDLVIDEDSLPVPGVYSRYGYISRFSLKGEHKWTRYFAVYNWDSYAIPRDLGLNSDNDIVLVANVSTQSVMNRVHFQDGSNLTGATNNDKSFFVVNYDSLGNIKWKDISVNLGYEAMNSVDFDSHNNMYLVGKFSSPDIMFGNQLVEGYSYSNDILVVSYDRYGNKRWAQKAGGFGSDIGAFMAIDTSDNLHIGGYITGSSATFGAYETNPPIPGNSIFVAQMKLEPIGFYATTPQQFGVSVYPNPSAGIISIVVQDELLSEINIYNSFGQEVKTLRPQHSTSQVSIQDLPSGYYILDIHVESGKHVVEKLIIE